MVFIKIWERYFLWEFSKTFFLLLLSFYGLFVLIDYSSHAANFYYHHADFQWGEFVRFYLFELIKRIEILIPFALLISTIRTLSHFNLHNELVALMSSGVKLRTLMRPFLFVGLFFTILLYINTEIWLPHALKGLKRIEDSHKSEKNKSQQLPSVQQIVLEDKTTIIFQSYDSAELFFFDAYWIRSIDEIYHIKYLYPNENTPLGRFVDHLVRNSSGELVVGAFFENRLFPEISFNKKTLFETITLPEEQSIAELWKKIPEKGVIMSEKESQVLSIFYYKLAMPWLCLLAVIGPAPFCVYFSRHQPVFFIYACSIFGLVSFYLLISACLVLGKRQVIPPLYAVGLPFLFFSGLFSWKFFRLRTF